MPDHRHPGVGTVVGGVVDGVVGGVVASGAAGKAVSAVNDGVVELGGKVGDTVSSAASTVKGWFS